MSFDAFREFKFLGKFLNAFVLSTHSGKYRLTPVTLHNCKNGRHTHITDTNVYADFNLVFYCKKGFGEKKIFSELFLALPRRYGLLIGTNSYFVYHYLIYKFICYSVRSDYIQIAHT